MKNAIIIDGTVYELVLNDTGEDVCKTCAIRTMSICTSAVMPCVDIHKAGHEYHYIKRQKGGER